MNDTVQVDKYWLEQLIQLAEAAREEQRYLSSFHNQTNLLISHALSAEDYLEDL